MGWVYGVICFCDCLDWFAEFVIVLLEFVAVLIFVWFSLWCFICLFVLRFMLVLMLFCIYIVCFVMGCVVVIIYVLLVVCGLLNCVKMFVGSHLRCQECKCLRTLLICCYSFVIRSILVSDRLLVGDICCLIFCCWVVYIAYVLLCVGCYLFDLRCFLGVLGLIVFSLVWFAWLVVVFWFGASY